VDINSLFRKGVEPSLEHLSVEPVHDNNLGGCFRCSLRDIADIRCIELAS
jgi:hypothetical protein